VPGRAGSRMVSDGTYAGALPSLNDLMAETGLSKNTVVRAIRMLVDEGLVETRQGRGAFVKKR
jgi:DNA-binding GntR family transcriptional regulator